MELKRFIIIFSISFIILQNSYSNVFFSLSPFSTNNKNIFIIEENVQIYDKNINAILKIKNNSNTKENVKFYLSLYSENNYQNSIPENLDIFHNKSKIELNINNDIESNSIIISFSMDFEPSEITEIEIKYSNHGILSTDNDKVQDYNLYNENEKFYELLSKYLKKTISKHPIEWDFKKIKDNKICETRGKNSIDESKCCDIAADLKSANSKLFGNNSFYFACAPFFYNKMDELNLLFQNPYIGKVVKIRHPLDANDRAKVKDKKHLAEDTIKINFNPGFATAVPSKTNSSLNEKFYRNLSYKGMDFAAINFCYKCSAYKDSMGIEHYGVDFPGTDNGNNPNAPVIALVNGRIWACTTHYGNVDEGVKGYGRIMIIKDDGDKLYILAHLKDFAGHKAGDYFSAGQVVAHAGNTGRSSATHLHLEMIECKLGMEDKARDSVLDMTYNQPHESDGGEKGSMNSYLKFNDSKDMYYASKKVGGHGPWNDNRLDPLTGEK